METSFRLTIESRRINRIKYSHHIGIFILGYTSSEIVNNIKKWAEDKYASSIVPDVYYPNDRRLYDYGNGLQVTVYTDMSKVFIEVIDTLKRINDENLDVLRSDLSKCGHIISNENFVR